MKKITKLLVIVCIIALVATVSSCSVFSALSKIFVDVQSGAGGNTTFNVKAYLYKVNADDTTTEIETKKANDFTPGSSLTLAFDNEVRAGTKVKVFIGLKSKNTSLLSGSTRYFKTEQTFIVEEGVNRPTFPAFEEATTGVWWY